MIDVLARFTDAANLPVTEEVVRAVTNEKTSTTLARSELQFYNFRFYRLNMILQEQLQHTLLLRRDDPGNLRVTMPKH